MALSANDPCPCGSGRKYKNCHQREQAEAAPEGDTGAAGRALTWLANRHGRAFARLLQERSSELVFAAAGRPEPPDFDDAIWSAFEGAITEWALADGVLRVQGRNVRTIELLLGRGGPLMTAAQRQFLEQLGAQPLRLYTVTDVVAGATVTLCDALDAQAPPVVVHEHLGSLSMKPGLLVGCRLLALGDRQVMSGTLCPFSMLAAPAAIDAVRAAQRKARPGEASLSILCEWLRQYAEPPRLPRLVDASSGEAMLLITDHYEVRDEAALAAALATCGDVVADAAGGWRREFEGSDGLVRSNVAINRGRAPDRLELFYRTQGHADAGRPWFEALAGGAVRRLTREITDPRSVLGNPSSAAPPAQPGLPDIPPEALADAIEKLMRRSYANWADEPIPALDGKTPRDACASAAGRERVKGLLRSYDANEERAAAGQVRPVMSYQFLWDGLGLER